MTSNEIQQQALALSAEEKLQLVNRLMRSLQPEIQPNASTSLKQKGLAASLVGIAKTDSPPPTDEEVRAILDNRLIEKYL